MAVSSNYLTYVLEQLRGIGGVRTRRMFGGVGLYANDVFFGLIAEDVVYLKVDDSNRSEYTARGSKAFRPLGDDPSYASMSYYEIPEDVLEDSDELTTWARKSVAIAAARAATKSAQRFAQTRRKKSRKH